MTQLPCGRTSSSARRWLSAVTALMVVFAIVQIILTARSLTQTFDEPNHLVAGIEWLQAGSYGLWPENPPLARLAIAIVPYLSGMRLNIKGLREQLPENVAISWAAGNSWLYGGGLNHYMRRLFRARLATLVFFLFTAGVVWLWAHQDGGSLSALLAVGLFCSIPPVLAHSALATTDVASAATILITVYAFTRWLRSPSWTRAATVGLSAGIATATKFSALLMLPACILSILFAGFVCGPCRRLLSALTFRRGICQFGLAALVGACVLLTVYRWDFGRIEDEPFASLPWMPLPAMKSEILPAPALFMGLNFLWLHNKGGHPAYALGEVSNHGFVYYYPLALLVKTPLPTLILILVCLYLLLSPHLKTKWETSVPLVSGLAILISVLPSNINIGVRHVMSVYPFVTVAVGVGLSQFVTKLSGKRRKLVLIATIGTLLCQMTIVFSTHPRHLSFFNALAGDDPAAVLIDSDLDWGQDLNGLQEYFADRNVPELWLAYFGTALPCKHDLPPLRALDSQLPTTGWVAISESIYRGVYEPYAQNPCIGWVRPMKGDAFNWLQDYEPLHIIGKSIRVYHIE